MPVADEKRPFLPILACGKRTRGRKERFDEDGQGGPSPQTSSSRLAQFLESPAAPTGTAAPDCIETRQATGVSAHQRPGIDSLVPPMASKFYRARWGVKVDCRSLKQTLARRKVLAKTPGSRGHAVGGERSGLGVIDATGRLGPRAADPATERFFGPQSGSPCSRSHALVRADNPLRHVASGCAQGSLYPAFNETSSRLATQKEGVAPSSRQIAQAESARKDPNERTLEGKCRPLWLTALHGTHGALGRHIRRRMRKRAVPGFWNRPRFGSCVASDAVSSGIEWSQFRNRTGSTTGR